MRTKELLCILLLFLVMAGCKDDNDDPVEKTQREFALSNFNNTGCKSSTESRSGLYGNDEYFELKAIKDGGLFVKHVNAIFNCASNKFEAKASIEGQTITVTEVNVMSIDSPMANCVCPFDFDYEIGPLKDGATYSMTIITTTDIGIDDPRIIVDSLKTSFSFTYSPTLSKTIPVTQ